MKLVRTIFFILLIFSLISGTGVKKIYANKYCYSSWSDSLSKKLLIVTDQALNRIIIVNTTTKEIVWEWKPMEDGIHPGDENWFDAPSDAKPVLNGKYVLVTASKGGVALIRIKDKKVVFYAFAGGNTHSAAILPDGNIIAASSTGNFLTVFHTDTLHFPGEVYSRKITLPFAHNVVWDKQRQVLWSAGKNKIYSFKYNFDCLHPDLKLLDSTTIPGTDAHDLYPVYGNDFLWLTTPGNIFQFNPVTGNIITIQGAVTKNVKDISSGPNGYPIVMMLPKEKWWTDEVTDENGKIIFRQMGLKIYKARWLLPDIFSENNDNFFNPCK